MRTVQMTLDNDLMETVDRIVKDLRIHLLTAELAYPSSFGYSAIHGGVLHRNEEFQVWMLLSAEQVRMLQLHKANKLEFRPSRR